MTLQGIVPKGKLPVSPPCVIPCLKHVSLPYLKHVSLPCVEQVSISYRLSCSDQSAFEHSDLHIFPEGSYLEFIPPTSHKLPSMQFPNQRLLACPTEVPGQGILLRGSDPEVRQLLREQQNLEDDQRDTYAKCSVPTILDHRALLVVSWPLK